MRNKQTNDRRVRGSSAGTMWAFAVSGGLAALLGACGPVDRVTVGESPVLDPVDIEGEELQSTYPMEWSGWRTYQKMECRETVYETGIEVTLSVAFSHLMAACDSCDQLFQLSSPSADLEICGGFLPSGVSSVYGLELGPRKESARLFEFHLLQKGWGGDSEWFAEPVAILELDSVFHDDLLLKEYDAEFGPMVEARLPTEYYSYTSTRWFDEDEYAVEGVAIFE